ncbi:Cupredoxin [Hysterangium stoloniferum]|nr:Cupredoxin [Hysterangium stoloniferum]
MFTKLAFATALVAAASAVNITINVGAGNALAFDPPSMTANVNDTLVFNFQSKNHSVWQSTFAAPCTSQGFTNQFFPVAPGAALIPQVTILVTSTDPIWFYCPQTIPANHCELGMVGAVNPPASKTFQQFQAAAMALASPTPSGTPSGTSAASPAATSSNGAVSLGTGKLLLAVAVIVALAL